MALIQHKSADKTVADISTRNAITPRPNHMTVVVLDAIGDPQVLGGKAVYKWNAETTTWLLLAKDNADTLNFTSEVKTIVGDTVLASNLPANSIIWDVYVVLDEANKIISHVEWSINNSTITLLGDTANQFNGKKLHYKYAYGTISQQMEALLESYNNNVTETLKQSLNVFSSATVASTYLLNPSLARTFLISLTEEMCNINFASFNIEENTTKEIIVLLKQTTGSNDFSFGNNVNWVNSVAPRSSFEVNKLDVIKLIFVDGLSKPIGFYEGGWIDV